MTWQLNYGKPYRATIIIWEGAASCWREVFSNSMFLCLLSPFLCSLKLKMGIVAFGHWSPLFAFRLLNIWISPISCNYALTTNWRTCVFLFISCNSANFLRDLFIARDEFTSFYLMLITTEDDIIKQNGLLNYSRFCLYSLTNGPLLSNNTIVRATSVASADDWQV